MLRLGLVVISASLAGLATGGCTYDYGQRTDRIAYSAGDAVRANIERETDDPAKKSMTSTYGLGKNGQVTDPDSDPALADSGT